MKSHLGIKFHPHESVYRFSLAYYSIPSFQRLCLLSLTQFFHCLQLPITTIHTHTLSLFLSLSLSHVADPEYREIQKENQLTSGCMPITNCFKLSTIQLCFHQLCHLSVFICLVFEPLKTYPFHSDNLRLNKPLKVLEIPQLNTHSKNMILPNNMKQDLFF